MGTKKKELQIPVLKEIFKKNLLLLIPFYIFSHESRFEEYEKDKTKLRFLLHHYGHVEQRAVMGGKVLEYEAKTIKREGIEEGIKGTVSILKNLGIYLHAHPYHTADHNRSGCSISKLQYQNQHTIKTLKYPTNQREGRLPFPRTVQPIITPP